MAFKNEYIPPVDQETSQFLKDARKTLRTGHKKDDDWTVDRENNRVLCLTGRGHDIDTYDEEYWGYIDERKYYSFSTKKINRQLISKENPRKISLTRNIIHFWSGEPYCGLPDKQTFMQIKEAFQAYGEFCMESQDEECHHNLLWNGGAA